VDERSSTVHSMTWSARNRPAGGIVSPRGCGMSDLDTEVMSPPPRRSRAGDLLGLGNEATGRAGTRIEGL
jgi:hypothetical protein